MLTLQHFWCLPVVGEVFEEERTMDSIYLTSLLVGGFFVLLSIFGGGESDHDADHDFDHDIDVDADHDFDSDFSVDLDGSPDFVDLLSLRALFLFAAFFGTYRSHAAMVWHRRAVEPDSLQEERVF